MKRRLASAAAMLVFAGSATLAFGHRLDEYLQATLIRLRQDRVEASMRLIPGVSVSASVLARIDSNHDGILSAAEQRSYAQGVLDDISLVADGHAITPRLISATFPPFDEMRDGTGEIDIQFTAPLAPGGSHRRLTLENRHLNGISVYLVNAIASDDPKIHIVAQKRNEQQSTYEVDYDQTGFRADTRFNVGNFVTLFSLGMHHIVEGADHLLFLFALLLPAPLIASRSHWVTSPGIRSGLVRILKIVTAFTVGHSVTLALAALGFVHVSSRPVEILIAVSILVSAIHALRPIFPGKEPAVATFFGLVHGLAFASTLSDLGLGWGERLAGILAFNLGIETMQILAVAMVLPSLILMSRTPAYAYLRIPAALFAAVASLGWMTERLLDINTPVDVIANAAAHHGVAIAGVLFVVSLACWGIAGRTTGELCGQKMTADLNTTVDLPTRRDSATITTLAVTGFLRGNDLEESR